MSEKIRGQKRYSLEERARILGDYHASGLTQREFVATAGISLACLSMWLRRAKLGRPQETYTQPSAGFVPVQLKETDGLPSGQRGRIEVELGGNVLVRLPKSYSQAEAVRFILQLRRGC